LCSSIDEPVRDELNLGGGRYNAWAGLNQGNLKAAPPASMGRLAKMIEPVQTGNESVVKVS
jgi:hypothetical protein